MDSEKVFSPGAIRLKIPATGTASISVAPMNDILDSVILCTPTAGFNGSDAGVRIIVNDGRIFPDMGSRVDSNFAGFDSYGPLPPTGCVYTLPFNRKLDGPPYTLTFEFYNAGASPVTVNVVIITARERVRVPLMKVEIKEKEAA